MTTATESCFLSSRGVFLSETCVLASSELNTADGKGDVSLCLSSARVFSGMLKCIGESKVAGVVSSVSLLKAAETGSEFTLLLRTRWPADFLRKLHLRLSKELFV